MTWVILWLSLFVAMIVTATVGMGGGILVLPLFLLLVGQPETAVLLTAALVLGNPIRVLFFRTHVRWFTVLLFALGSIPGAFYGASLLGTLDSRILNVIAGMALLIFVGFRLIFHGVRGIPLPRWTLPFPGFIAGAVSGVVGAAGPLIAPFFLGQELEGAAFVATMALHGTLIHGGKCVMYIQSGLLGWREGVWALSCIPVLWAGAWVGKRFHFALDPRKLDWALNAVLLLSALRLLWQGA